MAKLEDKVAFITGASSGIGAARLLRRGRLAGILDGGSGVSPKVSVVARGKTQVGHTREQAHPACFCFPPRRLGKAGTSE